jgi:hypothetical protein
MTTKISPSDIIAAIALIFSIYTTTKTIKFNNRQKSLIDLQEKLNKILLDKESSESSSEKKANLGASFVKIGSNNYRLKIWNKGKATAHNVMIEFPEGNEIISERDLENKFPLEVLDVYQSVEIIAAVHMNTKPKHAIKLIWSDGYNDRNEKIAYPTL